LAAIGRCRHGLRGLAQLQAVIGLASICARISVCPTEKQASAHHNGQRRDSDNDFIILRHENPRIDKLH